MELPKLDAPPSVDGNDWGLTNCGIGIIDGTGLRKGLPFGSPALCTDDERVEKRWHYCFWTKDPNPRRLSPAGWSVAGGATRYRYQ